MNSNRFCHIARRFLLKWLHAVTKEKPGMLNSGTLHRFYTEFEKLMESACHLIELREEMVNMKDVKAAAFNQDNFT